MRPVLRSDDEAVGAHNLGKLPRSGAGPRTAAQVSEGERLGDETGRRAKHA